MDNEQKILINEVRRNLEHALKENELTKSSRSFQSALELYRTALISLVEEYPNRYTLSVGIELLDKIYNNKSQNNVAGVDTIEKITFSLMNFENLQKESASVSKEFECVIDYAREFEKYLENLGVYFQSTNEGECTLFFFVMEALNSPCINLNVRVYSNGYVKMFCKLVTQVAYPQIEVTRNILNQLCGHFRYIRLFMNESNDVIATYDFIVAGDGEVASDHIFAMANQIGGKMGTMDRCVPYILSKLWGNISKLD